MSAPQQKRLYRVSVEGVAFVLAGSPSEAADIARGNLRDLELDCLPSEVTDGRMVDAEWFDERPFTAYCDPGYAEGDPTCGQIAARAAATPPPAAEERPMPLFEGAPVRPRPEEGSGA